MENMEPTYKHAGEQILVVEDSPTQAEQLRYMLEKYQYRISVARNGNEALAMIGKEQPALIISDIVMPGMDGYELCRRIKNHDLVCNIRIILLTSLSDPLDVIRGLECGADNFITKPYNEAFLVSRIGYLLENRYEPQDCAALPEITIKFAGREFTITSSRHQILDLLLSTYEAAIVKNNELSRARDELQTLNEQLKMSNQNLEAFGHTISHDLRGPLNNIFGSCQVINELYGSTLGEQCREFFQYILDAAGNMNNLIDTIMRFSLLSRQELHLEQVDLSTMARAILVEPRFNEPGRHITYHIAEGITVKGDAQLLRVALENLFGNACKYTSKNDRALIEFGISEVNGVPTYFVRDNGVGFDMAKVDRIFTAFQRLHTDSEFKGFGVGLSTVERIIQRHGGRIWAEGETDKGAVFYFTLRP